MGSIPNETIEQIAAANDVVEVIGGYFPLKRAGANYRALCPFHQEKTPSFHVSPSRQTFHCFGCGVGGSVFRFVMEYEHVDFPTAVRRLAARVGLPVVEERGAFGEHDRQQETRGLLLRLHAEAASWFHENLMKREVGAPAREYLKKRGIDRRTAAEWQLGYAPESWDALLKWATAEGYRRDHLVQSGLVKLREENRPQSDVYDRFRGRIIFPICNDIGEVVAFSGRILEAKSDSAKYLNSPETVLFRKGNILFGLHKTKRDLIGAARAIVCEGQLDLITLFEAGIRNVVAPQGTAFTESQARVLKRYVNEVILCFDADTAGEKAAARSLDALLQHDLVVRVLELPPGEDPDSLVRRGGTAEFEQLLSKARDFFDDWIERELRSTDLTSVAAKTQLARRLAQTIARVHDSFMRGEIAGKASARLGLPPAEFTALLPKEPARTASSSVQDRPAAAGAPVPHDMAMLCLLAVRDPGSRDFLREQDWETLLAQNTDTELLAKILRADLSPDEPVSMNVFLATLLPEEEALVSGWLMQKLPKNPLEVTRDWWNGLRQRALRRQLQIAQHRMKLPQISAGEVVLLQKQILDLQEQLREIPQLSPARVLDA